MIINFTVPGAPQGKARARTVRNKYTGKIHSYTPDKTAYYEKAVAVAYKNATNIVFNDEPILMHIYAYCPMPKSFSKRKRIEAAECRIFPTAKPDCDNIAKAVCDALNGVAYKDDKQIVGLFVHKLYSIVPRVEIELDCIGEQKPERNEAE